MSKTDLIIIGGGAAGLMEGCAAGELGLKALVLERKAKPGRKLLMCGNSRCNLTTNISEDRMIQMFGDPVGAFLDPALRAFTPSMSQRWFAGNGLKTVVKTGNKVYPHMDRAADVLNLFTDLLRDQNISLACSSVVQSLEKTTDGFRVTTDNFVVESKYVLIATGGVSYPKTGSVGDGQEWAKKLGHDLETYRSGLAGFEVEPAVIKDRVGKIYEKVTVDVFSNGKVIGQTRGVFEIEKWGVGGTALTDASRIVARHHLKNYVLKVNKFDGTAEEIRPINTRALKEAMVTVGGVTLSEISFKTMESKKMPGLYFAGEVMDVDGPTGGYNLQAAFSTTRLAVAAVGKRLGKKGYPETRAPEPRYSSRKRAPSRQRRR